MWALQSNEQRRSLDTRGAQAVLSRPWCSCADIFKCSCTSKVWRRGRDLSEGNGIYAEVTTGNRGRHGQRGEWGARGPFAAEAVHGTISRRDRQVLAAAHNGVVVGVLLSHVRNLLRFPSLIHLHILVTPESPLFLCVRHFPLCICPTHRPRSTTYEHTQS